MLKANTVDFPPKPTVSPEAKVRVQVVSPPRYDSNSRVVAPDPYLLLGGGEGGRKVRQVGLYQK